MHFAKNNPITLAQICGTHLGEIPTHLRHFTKAFGESLFTHMHIGHRIDYLYSLSRLDIGTEFVNDVAIGKLNDVIYLIDKDGRFDYIAMVVLRGLGSDRSNYAVRLFGATATDKITLPIKLCSFLRGCDVVQMPYFEEVIGETEICEGIEFRHYVPESYRFWNFWDITGNSWVIEPSDGFMDIHTTSYIAQFIKWASNVLGYKK